MPYETMTDEQKRAYDKALRRIMVCKKMGGEGQALDLSGLGLSEVPPEIGQLKSLTTLYLFSNQLSSVPAEIGQLKSLMMLYLFDNKLSSVPVEIGQLKSLTTLDLSGNPVSVLPAEIGQLKSLTTLDLSGNPVSVLPAEIGQLKSLTTLDLSGNPVSVLPAEIGQLESLTTLYLPDNQLSRVPVEIGQLKSLTTLDLSGNPLSSVPPEIGQLKSLTTLNLSENQLVSLPHGVCQLTRLESLFLHGNPELKIPPEILGPVVNDCKEYGGELDPAKPADILDYYFSIRGDQGRALREVKVILVGRGEVGKTTMVDRLMKKRFIKNRLRTDGIAITPWEIKLPDGAATLTFWDFGGQEIMHGTHQFFMTHRSLYVVMVDGRHDRAQQDAEYWLKLVRAFGGDSPVLVVMNRQKEHGFDLDRQALVQKYGVEVQHFFPTECSETKTLTPLREVILNEATRMLKAEERFPVACWAAKEELDQMKTTGQNYLSDDQYEALCSRHGIQDGEQQSRLLRRLADLGTVVSFPDDVRLAELSVLNPAWATDGIYRVVTNEDLRLHGSGVMNRRRLRKLLTVDRWPKPKHVQYVVNLMRKFELCFLVDDDGNDILIPELLVNQTPELGDWKPEECVVFQYQYPVLPHGVLPRFITRTHELSAGQQRWRSGVVLADDGAEARVQADYDANKLSIWVRGAYADARRGLLKIIRSHFEVIHGKIKELNPEEHVAVPGHPETLIPYRDLVMDERSGESICRVTLNPGTPKAERVPYKISDLLDGVESREDRRRKAALEKGAYRGGDMHLHLHKHNELHLDQSLTIDGDVEGCQVAHAIADSRNQLRVKASKPGAKKSTRARKLEG